MHALAANGIEITGERCNQRLAFAGPHFRDFAAMQNDTADKLDVVMALAEGSFCGFPDDCKGFGKNIVKRLAASGPFLERHRFRREFFV